MINLNCLLVLPSWSLSSARLRNHGHCCRPTAAEIALTSAHSWHPPVPPEPRPQLQHDGDLQDQAPPHPHSVSQVASERNDREQFLRSGVNPGYGGVRQNGTYSSHPNLPTFDPLTHPSQLSAFPPIEPPALPKMVPLPRPPVRQPAKDFNCSSCPPGCTGWKPPKASGASKTTFLPQVANLAPGRTRDIEMLE